MPYTLGSAYNKESPLTGRVGSLELSGPEMVSRLAQDQLQREAVNVPKPSPSLPKPFVNPIKVPRPITIGDVHAEGEIPTIGSTVRAPIEAYTRRGPTTPRADYRDYMDVPEEESPNPFAPSSTTAPVEEDLLGDYSFVGEVEGILADAMAGLQADDGVGGVSTLSSGILGLAGQGIESYYRSPYAAQGTRYNPYL